jgi:hypothetical protein
MIMRMWRGWTRAEDAAAYETYLLATGYVGYTEAEGNRGVCFTRRDSARCPRHDHPTFRADARFFGAERRHSLCFLWVWGSGSVGLGCSAIAKRDVFV